MKKYEHKEVHYTANNMYRVIEHLDAGYEVLISNRFTWGGTDWISFILRKEIEDAN